MKLFEFSLNIFIQIIFTYTQLKHKTNNLGLERKLRVYLILLLRNDKTRNISMAYSNLLIIALIYYYRGFVFSAETRDQRHFWKMATGMGCQVILWRSLFSWANLENDNVAGVIEIHLWKRNVLWFKKCKSTTSQTHKDTHSVRIPC